MVLLGLLGACRATSPAVSTPVADLAPPPPRTYIGAAKCGGCHKKELAAWRQSWHARALARADNATVVGNFAGAHFRGSSSEAWMTTTDGRAQMRTRGIEGKLGDFAVDWVIGGKRMQDALTVLPDGRWQVLPVYWHTTAREWVDYTESKQGPLTPEHPFFWANFRRTANRECLDCHVTGLRVRYDGGRWSTEMVDAGVACEDCHGPGSTHAASEEPGDIFHPGKAARARALDACAQCHGPRNPLFPLLDADHRFRPGEVYDDFYDPIVVLIAGRLSGDFFVDGRPKSSSFEYQALLQSACYRRGGATCLTCHAAPHEPHGPSELKGGPDDACRGCHKEIAAAGRAHTHHTDAKANTCVACHMPRVVSGVLDKFADHAIDVPVPGNHDVPDACSTCHAGRKDLQRALVGWWPKAAARQARRMRLADAIDDRTAKDSARPLLQVMADAAEAPTLRGAAAVLLAERFGPQAAMAVVPLLRAEDPLLRAKACEALAVGRATGAADALAAVVDDPSPSVRLAAAMALASMNDRRAEAALRALVGDARTTALWQPHFMLARGLLSRGDLAGARSELATVVRLTPYNADALTLLADVTARMGDPAAARALLEEALRFDPQHAGARARLKGG
jgi:hypothetical protein